MKLYNTLTHTKSELEPITPGEIKLYTCGPTVYDYAHIGNLRTYVFEDMLRRNLRRSYSVEHVMNLTDVDDKTIKRSQESFPELDTRDALLKLTQHFAEEFLKDADMIGIDFEQTTLENATDNIVEMQEMIRKIYQNGFAYTTDDGVYFNTNKYHNESGAEYGVLSPTALQGIATESDRTAQDEYDKHEAIDFALWKLAKPSEPSWPFELDGKDLTGRPGWHIECSAMSIKDLGQPFDIHTGGVDLKFPHHENEIAQALAALPKGEAQGKKFANYFLHSEHLLVDGIKMAKSQQNFFTLPDIIGKGYSPLSFRLLILQAHYRSELNFTWASLRGAQNFLIKLYGWADLQFQPTPGSSNPDFSARLRGTLTTMAEALDDDLGTPAAVAALSLLVDWMQKAPLPERDVEEFKEALATIDQMLGLGLRERTDIADEAKQIIASREEMRLQENFKQADVFRKELTKIGLEVSDTANGPRWKRKSI